MANGTRHDARRRLQGDHRAAPAGRPPVVRRDRQGRRPLRGRRAAAGAAADRGRRHADRRRHRPAELGFARQAMVGIRVTGALEPVADALAEIDEVDYVVLTAGSFDLLAEVVCRERRAPARDHLRPRSARSPASPAPRPSSTSSCASRPTRGASAERSAVVRRPLLLARHRRRRLDAARRPLPGDLDVDVADRRRRLHRAVDRLLPGRGGPVAARRRARGRGGRVRRLRAQRRLVLGTVPRASCPPSRRWAAGTPRSPSTGRCARPSTRSPGSPRPRASTRTSPRAGRSGWPAAPPSSRGRGPRSRRRGAGAAARTTCRSSTPRRRRAIVRADGVAGRDVHPRLRGDPPGAAGARAGRGRSSAAA